MKKIIFLIVCSISFILGVQASYVLPSNQNEFTQLSKVNDMKQIDDGLLYVGSGVTGNGVLLKYDLNGSQVLKKEYRSELLKVIELSDKKIVALISRGFVLFDASFNIIKEYENVGPATEEGIHYAEYADIASTTDGFLLAGWHSVKKNDILLKGNGVVLKYDNSGNVVWEKTSTIEMSNYMAFDCDSDENIYAVGSIGADVKTMAGLITKLDKNGNIIFDKTLKKEDSGALYDVIVANNSITARGLAVIANDKGEVTDGNFGIIQFDMSGNKRWSYVSLNGGLYGIVPSCFTLLPNGTFLVAGNRAATLSDKNYPMYFIISDNGEILEYQGVFENNTLRETSLYYTSAHVVNINGVETIQLGGTKDNKGWSAFLTNQTNHQNYIFQNANYKVDKIEAPLTAKAGELVKLNFLDGTYKRDFKILNYYTMEDITHEVYFNSGDNTFLMPNYAITLDYHYIEGEYFINQSIFYPYGSVEAPSTGKAGERVTLEMKYDKEKYAPEIKILNWNNREDVTEKVKFDGSSFIMPDYMVDLVYEFHAIEENHPSDKEENKPVDDKKDNESKEEIENPKTGASIPSILYILGLIGLILLFKVNRSKNYFKKL